LRSQPTPNYIPAKIRTQHTPADDKDDKKDLLSRAHRLDHEGITLFRQLKTNEALEKFQQALSLIETVNTEFHEEDPAYAKHCLFNYAATHHLHGQTMFRKANFEAACHHFKVAIELFNSIKNTDRKTQSEVYLARAEEKFETAIELHQSAIQTLLTHYSHLNEKDQKRLLLFQQDYMITLMMAGTAFLEKEKNYLTAIHHFETVLSLLKIVAAKNAIAVSLAERKLAVALAHHAFDLEQKNETQLFYFKRAKNLFQAHASDLTEEERNLFNECPKTLDTTSTASQACSQLFFNSLKTHHSDSFETKTRQFTAF
jgi:tetratricopeptide (TPR) repeat protein